MNYIIIQAGGRGSRLGYLTKNKPKALTPIENLPMIFHLFRKYPDKRFIIIADYKKSVLRKYLATFCDVKYQVVDALGTGTCSGVKQAIELIPEKEPFMLTWSDLILPDKFELPKDYLNEKKPKWNGIGISSNFPCRWKYENGTLSETCSTKHGVAGLFLFREKEIINKVPTSGELVRWMSEQRLSFKEVNLAGTQEFGCLEEYEKLAIQKTRPFNRITVENDTLIKEPIDSQGKELAVYENAWYEKAKKRQITGIPRIYGMKPLKMEYIKGKNIYECQLPYENKRKVLKKIICTLEKLHSSERVVADSFSIKEAYFNKTMQRLLKVENLLPFTHEKYIRVNGRNCRNVFFFRDKLEMALEQLKCESFCFIHGDCTFSNLMLRDNGEPVLIDPRGYFGFTELYGDERYDWAKLYYSIIGNYDCFNLKKFSLDISDEEVKLEVESNNWEDTAEDFFNLTGAKPYEIKLLHAIIWLSLTTYAWQDYDSICGAFYNGLYYLEEVL